MPFTHAAFGGYLVARLDGYTQADAMSLVTRAMATRATRSEEEVLLDVQPGFGMDDKTVQPLPVTTDIPDEAHWSSWNADMAHAADLLRGSDVSVELDMNEAFVGGRTNLLDYFSWGSNDSHFTNEAYQSLRFAPGSIGDTAVLTSARTFLPASGGTIADRRSDCSWDHRHKGVCE